MATNPAIQSVPAHIAAHYRKWLGFTATCRVRPVSQNVDIKYAFLGREARMLDLNREVRDEYNETAGVHEDYVWFENEADAMHYLLRNK